MGKYWLGILNSTQGVLSFENRAWWCFPKDASPGDYIVMYCPRSASPRYQGIFVLCEVIQGPTDNHQKNYLCSGFGFGRAGSVCLNYCELKVIRRYKNHLTAKEMKEDPIIKTLWALRKNFQGTTFRVDKHIFEAIIKLIDSKQQN